IGQAIGLASSPTVDPEAMEPPGLPVPADPAAVSLFTAHRVNEIGHKLTHASQRMKAARDATGDLRKYHASLLAGHLEAALRAGHDLAANLRDHYPDEAGELEAVKDAVGLAKAVSDDAKSATTAHLLETSLHELAHASEHAKAITEDTPDDEWSFNADHAEKHLGGAAEHAGKLRQHLADNYPGEAKWLAGLGAAESPAEDGGGKQHARYAKADGGTITAQLANAEAVSGQDRLAVRPKVPSGTITGQFLLTGDGHGHHIPGTPFDWRHPWVPLTPVAAKSHFHGKVPDRWHQESASRASGLQRAAPESDLTDEAETAVKNFAAQAHAVVPGMLGGGRSDWNGKVALFNAKDRPAVAAYMGWDGTMGFQRELAERLTENTKGVKVTDPVTAFMPHIDVLHELIHGTVPAGGESAEWKALPAGHRTALSAFSHMDKGNPTGGATPTLHTLADARERDTGISQDTIDDLASRGLLARSPTTSSTYNPETGQSTPPVHSWRLTAAGRDTLPSAPQTHEMHKGAYQDPQNAAIEEGFTELGAVHHAPEFLTQMGVGDQETGMMSVTSAGRPREEFDKTDLAARKDEIAKLAAQANEATSASAELQLRMAAREMGKASPDVGSVIEHLSKAHLAAKDDGLKGGIWQAMGELNLTPSKVRRATVAEYAEHLRDPDRIAKGEAWGHYGWQTAAAQQWVLDAAKAERKGPKSQRVRELADEINREGVGGKVPAMARQVIRAAGVDPDKFQGAPLAALETRIQRQWAKDPAGAEASPWKSAMAVVRQYDREH
ncbi:MAG TPA: hypothetical protein VGH54_13410, partial [Mycobacterium sp.]|uniref:hypothetical protein n=1 Tax=Mycobacterium sp. TaxID=1785 RepID=UPI002F41FEB7